MLCLPLGCRIRIVAILENVCERHIHQIAVHTSPGNSAMAAVWILLAETKYAGTRRFKGWLDKAGKPARKPASQDALAVDLESSPP